MREKDVIVIGAGAAGLLCAIEAGKRGRKTVVLESADKVGNKILISGGGRCNFTNTNSRPECFISENPHFCKSALARYTPQDFITLVEKHGIKYHEKKLGQLFCDGSAKEIVNMLLKECEDAGVEIVTNCNIRKISPHPSTGLRLRGVVDQPLSNPVNITRDASEGEGSFSVITNQEIYTSESLVIASGGVSIPQMGATDFGYMRARQFDISLTEIRPGLVPLTFNKWKFSELSGVSVDSIVSCNNQIFRENMLFTHKGLSGPAILQISNYWKPGDAITINLLPDKNFEEMLIKDKASRIQLDNFLSQHLPKRFADKFSEMYFQAKPLYKLKESAFAEIAEKIHNWSVKPSGTEGFQKAEVTLGGVNTDELSSKTMEAKKVKGLYFIGEVVDVTGWLGGYNFQWAWASGYAAGQYV